MKFLLPKQPVFFELFKELNNCIKEITALFNEFSVSFKDFESFFVRAKEIEHKGDNVTRKIVDYLNKTFITPFDREDLYLLAHEMDDIIDLINHAIQAIYIYQVSEKKAGVDEFINLAVKASNELDKLVHGCFEQQKNSSAIEGWVVKIHELEDDADLLYQKCIRQLFNEENDPKNIIKWKDIFLNLEDIMDEFQSVSNTIEGIIVKSS